MKNNEFIDNLMEEHFEWRIKELALIKKIYLKLRTENEKKFFLQTTIPIIYAIWEGFIKNTLSSLFEFLDNKEISSDKIKDTLLVLVLEDKINDIQQSKDFKKRVKHSSLLIKKLKSKIKFSNIKINTKSNLDDKTLLEICFKVGLNSDNFDKNILNQLRKLVRDRNIISHGEKNGIVIKDINKVEEYISLIRELMDNFILAIDEFINEENYLLKE